jgi:hypothetical protein
MPSVDEILQGLSSVANRGLPLALAWHVALGAALTALACGWRPSDRRARLILSTPFASVAASSFAFDQPFNGIVFTAAAVGLTLLAWSGAAEPRPRGGTWTLAAGVGSIAFGWLYPHFLADPPAWARLLGAPVGILPCPTLAVVIGFALLGPGWSARAWSGALAVLGGVYGLFGLLVLQVRLDIGLLLAAAALGAVVLSTRATPSAAS